MERLAAIDRRLIYLLAAAIVVVTHFVPLGLPIAVSDQVKRIHETVDGLPDDSVVVISPLYDAAGAGQLNPIFTAFLTHCAERGYRILVLAPGWGLDAAHPIVSQVLARHGYVYGRDYLEWGAWRSPKTTAWMQTAVSDFVQACGGVDYHGQALAELPLAREVPRLTRDHIAAILVVECGMPGAQEWFTYVAEVTGIPMAAGEPGPYPGEIIPYVPPPAWARIEGLRQCAEYEYLLGHSGDAIKTQDVMTLIALMVLVFVILGNVGHVARRRKALAALPAASPADPAAPEERGKT